MSDQPEGDAGTAFAAGVASEKASNAEEAAAEASAVAEAAEQRAEAAQERVAAAEEDAWDARAEVGALRGEMAGAFESLRAEIGEMLAPKAPANEEAPAGSPAPPEKKEAEAAPKEAEPEAKPKGYGSHGWFGGR